METIEPKPPLAANYEKRISSTPGTEESVKFLDVMHHRVRKTCSDLEEETPDDEVSLAICNLLIDELDRKMRTSIVQTELLAAQGNREAIPSLKTSKRIDPDMKHHLSTRRRRLTLDELNFFLTIVCPTVKQSGDDIIRKLCNRTKFLIKKWSNVRKTFI